MLKHKRVVLVALAVVFLVSVFFTQARSQWKNEGAKGEQNAGLITGDELVGELISKDTDGDGVEDWEEGLWGTDPTKKDTDGDGVFDSSYIAKLKAERGQQNQSASIEGGVSSDENLTQTDKFARELFSTVAALNQAGEVDDGTVNQLTNSLATQIQNPVQRKIFNTSDIKITSDNSKNALVAYGEGTDKIFLNKFPFDEKVAAVLQKFSESGEDADTSILSELDPTIKNLGELVDGMLKISVPQGISSYHLEVTNALERVYENLSDIRNIENDPIVTLGAINKYPDNLDTLNNAILNELKAIMSKIK